MKKYLPIIIVAAVLIFDQWLKIYVKLNFKLHESYTVFADWFELYFVENNGMAFGWAFGGKVGKLILSLFRVFASIFIFSYWRKLMKKDTPTGYTISIGLIFAGAVGNIIDSLIYGPLFGPSLEWTLATFLPEQGGYAPMLFGNVVDMLHFSLFYWPEWIPLLGNTEFFSPIFNIADASITGGIIAIFIFYRGYFEKEFGKNKTEEVSKIENSYE